MCDLSFESFRRDESNKCPLNRISFELQDNMPTRNRVYKFRRFAYRLRIVNPFLAYPERSACTVLHIIKLTSLPVISGSAPVPVKTFCRLFTMFCLRDLRTFYVVWGRVRRRVTRRLTQLQIMCNVLKQQSLLISTCS